jgi:hypothetical protein
MGANSRDALSVYGRDEGVIPLERTVKGYLCLGRRREGKRRRQNHRRHRQVDLRSRCVFHMRTFTVSGISFRADLSGGQSGSPATNKESRDLRLQRLG